MKKMQKKIMKSPNSHSHINSSLETGSAADCGYVFTKGPDAWKALPNNWSCPPCGSVKRRFKKVPKGSVKDTSGAAEQPRKKGLFGF